MRRCFGAFVALVSLIVFVGFSGCKPTKGARFVLVLAEGEEVSEELVVAKELIGVESLSTLRRGLKERFPNLTDDVIARVRVDWRIDEFRSSSGKPPFKRVSMIVSVIDSPRVDPNAVVAVGAELLSAQYQAKFGSKSSAR